ncbi:MAG: hypothetical protein KIT19_08950 [Phycisphaeraceae bacterium]|nr:hypothetical protein [Phycisphaeraceae bacterium]
MSDSGLSSRSWPRVDPCHDGRLELSFDAPLNKRDRVNWLLVRDWLVSEWHATFRTAKDFPTFEWLVELDVRDGTRSVPLLLLWADFPDELLLRSQTPEGNDAVRRIADRLSQSRPDLGTLAHMDRAAWTEWVVALGSHDFRSR